MPKNYILRNVDEQLWHRIKVQAAQEGISVKALILRSLEQGLAKHDKAQLVGRTMVQVLTK